MRGTAFAMAIVLAGPAFAQQPADRQTIRYQAWPAYLGATAPACGIRPPEWGAALPKGLITDALYRPAQWGIPVRSVLGSRFADPMELARAAGAIHAAEAIGALLHQRIPRETCAEARRVAELSDPLVAAANQQNSVHAPPPQALDAARAIFVVDLATACAARPTAWAERAVLRPATVLTELRDGVPPGGSERRNALARINGAEEMASYAAPTARRVFGRALCESLRRWPELATADRDAAAEQERRQQPGGRWRDIQPIQ